MSQNNKNKDIKNLSFEDASSQLENIISKMEEGDMALDETINYYNQGLALYQHCKLKLSEAKIKVEKVVNGEDSSKALQEVNTFGE